MRAFRARVHTLIFVVAELLDEEDEDTRDARPCGRTPPNAAERDRVAHRRAPGTPRRGGRARGLRHRRRAGRRAAGGHRPLPRRDVRQAARRAALPAAGRPARRSAPPPRPARHRPACPRCWRRRSAGSPRWSTGSRGSATTGSASPSPSRGSRTRSWRAASTTRPPPPTNRPAAPTLDATGDGTATGDRDRRRGDRPRGDRRRGDRPRGTGDAATTRSPAAAPVTGPPSPTTRPSSRLALTTRQAVQVGVATSLAIVGGELISPSRWYWAVIAAFVVFAGTSSRGDVLTRGRGPRHRHDRRRRRGHGARLRRRRRPGADARVAARLPLPRDLHGAHLAGAPRVLDHRAARVALRPHRPVQRRDPRAADRGDRDRRDPRDARGLPHPADGHPRGLRHRARRGRGRRPTRCSTPPSSAYSGVPSRSRRWSSPATWTPRSACCANGPTRWTTRSPAAAAAPATRGRCGCSRRSTTTSACWPASPTPRAPPTGPRPSCPRSTRIRTNLDGLRALLMHIDGPEVISAERAVDQAEAHAAHNPDPELRRQLLVATRLLRRMDQAVYGFAVDLGAPQPEPRRPPRRPARPAGAPGRRP